MKTRIVPVVLALVLSSFAVAAGAQDAKPYKEGPVTAVSFIKIKPGKFDDYMKFLDTQYKAYLEAEKKAGLVVGYGVFQTLARTPQDADLILTVTYANMAALDRGEEEEAVAAKVLGSSDMQNKAYVDRQALREVLGGQIIRELVLK